MLEPLIIFFAQLLYVPVLTLRTIMMVKSQKGKASGLGVLEGIIYVVAVGLVLSDLTNYYNMAAYALGFGVGLYIGAYVEEKLAIGYVTIEANIPQSNEELVNRLREVGFSVSTSKVQGIDAERYLLHCTARRDREKEFYRIIESYEEKAFVASFEPRSFKGGYITKGMKRRWELFNRRKQNKKSA
ncbi:DUF2179 domain-containing protein [Alkalicoccus halolimnae]|uniref:UPF0316 protein FTX54_010310 n=1 Tax=Alkalicoccus halolimnae TaxID=1667239 RepID=A0A5C7F9Q7_9BACI|nr:DUF2179 domain-containing protein [Alkalicoccus halolimnae]TXF82502.1 DUF2179 domain-containing protein [Alkalicoccus halolimnae]